MNQAKEKISPTSIKIPPHDMEAEQALLCACMINPEVIPSAAQIVDGQDFYREAHEHIWNALVETKSGDLVVIADWLKSHNLLEKAEGIDYLGSLVQVLFTSAAWEYHASIIKEKSCLRNIIYKNISTSEQAYQSFPSSEIITTQIQSLREISNNNEIVDYINNKKLYSEEYDNALTSEKKEPGLYCGLPGKLEELYFERGYIHCIAAESGTGKSAICLQTADYISERYGLVLYYSLESTRSMLAKRMLARHSNIALSRIHYSNIEHNQLKDFTDTIDELQSSRVALIDDSKYLTIEKLVNHTESIAVDVNINMIFVDFLQLMESNQKISSRHQEISYIVRQFKALAKNLDVPILFISQLRKDIKGRPTLDDLKESGDIRTHTDNIAFLYAPWGNEGIEYPVEFFVAKGKEQRLRKQWLEFNGNYQKFSLGIEPENKHNTKKQWYDEV